MTDKNNETKVFGEYDASVVSSKARSYTTTTTDNEGAYYEPPSYSDVSGTTTTTDDTDYDSGLVRSIDINPWRKDMKVRETFRFTANVYPENAANKAVYWNTGNLNVATVDSFGNVTATGEGHTFVFATAKDGSGMTGNAVIYVTADNTGEYPDVPSNPDIGTTTTTTIVNVSSVTINGGRNLTLLKGETYQVLASILPVDATNRNIRWSSGSESIVSVDSEGFVTGKETGTTYIKAEAMDGSGVKGLCLVTVVPRASSVTINKRNLILRIGEEETLTAIVTPEAAPQYVVWESENKNVAIVYQNGHVVTKGVGITKIRALAMDGGGAVGECVVTVVPIPVCCITVSPESVILEEGQTEQLDAFVYPSDATNKEVEWCSHDPAVATVDANGMVTAIAPGTAYIFAKSQDGTEQMGYCEVTVKPYITVNGWLRMYFEPTVSSAGRKVEIPNVEPYIGEDGYTYRFEDKNTWYTYENPYSTLISGAIKEYLESIGKTVTVNVGSKGEYTDENGRYWMALGPKVINPDFPDNKMPFPKDMASKGLIDVVVIRDRDNTKFYIPAVLGDVKGHTWNNGVIQTYKSYPKGKYESYCRNYDGVVAAEFIGDLKNDFGGLYKYSIDSLIFYPF